MRVGLIGAGLQGRRRAAALKGLADSPLVIVADVREEAAKALAQEMACRATACWQEVVAQDEVEAVIVATPPHLHAPIALAAMGKGKHVLCEKPLGRTLAEAEEMVRVAEETGVRLKCGFNLRHHPGIAQARDWLWRGAIGETTFLRCRYGIGGRMGYEREWRANPEISGGGQLMDQGIHILDLCRWFLGDFVEVFGFLSTAFWDIAPLEDNVFALLSTAKGQVAFVHASWTQWKPLFSLEVFGRDGYIVVEGLGGSYGSERAILGRRDFTAPFSEEVVEFRGQDRSWRGEWEEFLAAIAEGRQPLASGRDGLEALRLALAIYEAAASRRWVTLAPASPQARP